MEATAAAKSHRRCHERDVRAGVAELSAAVPLFFCVFSPSSSPPPPGKQDEGRGGLAWLFRSKDVKLDVSKKKDRECVEPA
jgi:hypothetical protein